MPKLSFKVICNCFGISERLWIALFFTMAFFTFCNAGETSPEDSKDSKDSVSYKKTNVAKLYVAEGTVLIVDKDSPIEIVYVQKKEPVKKKQLNKKIEAKTEPLKPEKKVEKSEKELPIFVFQAGNQSFSYFLYGTGSCINGVLPVPSWSFKPIISHSGSVDKKLFDLLNNQNIQKM